MSPPSSTAAKMYDHIQAMLLNQPTKYPVITKSEAPWARWNPPSPLSTANQTTELRTCFHSGSQIHKLSCGHTVSTVARDGAAAAAAAAPELCAANCIPPATNCPFSPDDPLVRDYVSPVGKIRNSIQAVLGQNYRDNKAAGLPHADTEFTGHSQILLQVWTSQARRIAPQTDLLNGNFTCHSCSLPGPRATIPAYIVAAKPYISLGADDADRSYDCAVLGHDEVDRAVIRELERGTVPQRATVEQESESDEDEVEDDDDEKDLSRGRKSGHGGRRRPARRGRNAAAFNPDRVRDAGITKARVAEKKKVLGRILEEVVEEAVERMTL